MSRKPRRAAVRDAVQTCAACGWSSKPSTPGLADAALRRHSCARKKARDAAALRGRTRFAAIDRTPKICQHPLADHQHGTYAAYVLDHCRCGPCCDAQHEYETNRVRTHAYGTWAGLIDAEPARQHVRSLLAAGLGRRRILAISGVSAGVFTKLIHGIGERPPAARIRPETAAKLLAIPVPTIAGLAPGARVPAIGARRRIQALARLGWSTPKLAQLAGFDVQRIYGLLTRDLTLVQTHVAITRLYDQIWDQRPPMVSHEDKVAAARARNRASKAGWPAPMDWDDEAIDLPTSAPAATACGARTIEQLIDDFQTIRDSSADLTVIAARLGTTPGALTRALQRVGRHDLLAVAS